MFSKLTRDFWPASVAKPYQRLGLAFAIAPLIPALVITGLSFLLYGMTEAFGEEVFRLTLVTALTAAVGMYAFTLSFGAIAFVLLWLMHQRSILAFGLMGIVAGVAGAATLSLVGREIGMSSMVSVSAVGMATMLLLRGISGVRGKQPEGVLTEA